jgi:hypothetical protein
MNMGWSPEYVEDNLTTTLQKTLERVWSKNIPLSRAAGLMCQYLKIWEPAVKRQNDWGALSSLLGG